ncbi:unnamed protein product (macronuclear) [Paramecium tetraurelia]|uniref:C2 NT-type domain-containing protein n=1 Tax=Paramecium tetraurelia TaxID=5888 RepID=A0E3G3_PARTE|nr:uncharacterized protein GSPATT00023003001 [Paramecium tetraurelia]CAK89830.1 unnamed protein product [Paramecium tetraurelia]|eukprot:XP_001457227.1 hypothetical protein (macronuclear) [Paramecium tetraurelia strain d4-2]
MNIRGFKFLVEATIINVQISVQFNCKIQVILKRGIPFHSQLIQKGSQKLETQPTYELQKGIAIINESLNCTISVNLGADGKFEEKKTQIIVILVTDKGQKNAGMHNMNLSQYLNQQQFEFQEVLPLEKCPDKNAKVVVNFKIKQIGEIDQELETTDQSLDTSQVSIQTPKKMMQELKNDNSDKKNQDSDLNNQIQKLKLKLNDMVDKEFHQESILNYEQQLQEQNAKLKTIINENTMIHAQLKAKSFVIDQQTDEIAQLKSKLNEYELENQGNYKTQINILNEKNMQLENLVIELKQEINNLNTIIQETQKESFNSNENNQIEQLNEEIESLKKQVKEKNEQIQNLKNLTSGTIMALQQRNEALEKRLNEQKDAVEKLKNQDQAAKAISSNDSSILVEELQSALSIKKQDFETLQQKYEQELAKKEEIVQNLQHKLEESMRKELDTSKTSQDSKNQAYQLEKQIEVSTNQQDKSKVEQQMARLRSQVQQWQSKWESNLKVLSDYNNEVQQMQRQIADVPSFIDDQKELPDQLQSLKRAIQSKLQGYQQSQISLEQRVQQLQQELEICQYKLKLEQSQQCSDSQFQEQMHAHNEETQRLNSTLQQQSDELKELRQLSEQQKQSELDLQKQLEETKSQLNTVRQNMMKCKQQLAEALQEKVLLQAKMAEQQKSIKEKNSEIQKSQELIAELEQYNIQMEETITTTLDQYKIQNQQTKQSYEKEKKWRQELSEQIKVLKEELSKLQQGLGTQQKVEQEIKQQCNCQEQLKQNQHYIEELQQQIAELQLFKLEQGIQRNSIVQIRTSIYASRRNSLIQPQVDDLNKKDDAFVSQRNVQQNDIGRIQELEEYINHLTNEKIKVSKDYQNEIERVLSANDELDKKCIKLLQELELSKIKIGDIFNAAIEIGGTPLVDKLQIAFGIEEE